VSAPGYFSQTGHIQYLILFTIMYQWYYFLALAKPGGE
jgi:hypothetical protein